MERLSFLAMTAGVAPPVAFAAEAQANTEVSAKTARRANTHHTKSAVILSNFTKVSPGVAARTVRTAYAERVDLATIQPELDAAVKYGLLKTSLSAADLLWTPPQ